ncbi:DegT/DnrJ/EryC1/StrS family aminotransferase [Pontibacillus salicampi]|uniref:DegT/DnrJ/EryC1/StrS family aminotransferase n=1 Tax=Pontibacillus salicampi TaxID=1449801 RepID=A0ABV6LQN4_9BACI
MENYYPVSNPTLNGNEVKYAIDCLQSTWISSKGKYINTFETAFAKQHDSLHGIACNNGTSALHLALMSLGCNAGDEIIVPTLTFVATANAVTYCGAKPVLVDAEEDTWNIDPSAIEKAITENTKGIIVVHLYGHPTNMDPVMDVAKKYNLFVIEDAAEAHGAEYKGKKVGSIGDCGTFSFFGNKIITTGEGGMITTNNRQLAQSMKKLSSHGMDPSERYWYPQVGYNYRMTNIQAAIGYAQLENLDWHLSQRKRIASLYNEQLKGHPSLVLPKEADWAKHSYWMYSVLLPVKTRKERDSIMADLLKKGIETRPFFYPMHVLPPYEDKRKGAYPVAERLYVKGINLPSYASLQEEDIAYISTSLLESL